jgi:hypothetical protein
MPVRRYLFLKKKNNMAKSRNKMERKNVIFLTVVFIVLLLVGGLSKYYYNKVTDLNDYIFPSMEEGGFTLFNPLKVSNLEKKNIRSGMMVGLRPGEKFEGILGLKNHDKFEHVFGLEIVPFYMVDEGTGEMIETDFLPEITLPSLAYKLDGLDITFVDYSLTVPADIMPGSYVGLVRAIVTDPTAQKLIRDNVVLDLAIGVPVYLTVAEEPPVYEYLDLSDQAERVSRGLVFSLSRIIIALTLIVITFYLLYKAYFESKKTKK